ncbi:Peptidase A1 domain-containing protein [Caenorhabditis elegans]|nr:Peptidase A1 domain-containing protein [Caenorhabditis elegans]CUV67072.1 Peptidase A1 domain-containing protein [Caenorhabditis elegans]|eukprot:NP_001305219.1 Uncharacterized protein CELE_F46F5.15 [Caenorhabditis elegans]
MLIDRVSIMSCHEYENYISEIPEDMELLQSKLQGVTLTIPVDGYGVVLNLYNAYPPQTKLGCIHSKCKGSFQCILGPEEKLSSSGFVEGMPASNCTASTGLMCKPSVTAKGTLFTIILSIIHFI